MEAQEKIAALSKNQLADAYNVSLRTFTSWIDPFKDDIGEYRGKTFTPKQVSIIFDLLGRP
ncbi:MAG TPA: hypothetical protein DCG75_01860 [Bacteroidales bacterium]|nr:hypothetical protein [Bacteroidales bacterium]